MSNALNLSHLSDDIVNLPNIILSDEEKKDVNDEDIYTKNYEFQLMNKNIQYNHNVYRSNIGKVAKILNTTIINSGDNLVTNLEIISENNYKIKPVEELAKIYFIKSSNEEN